MSYEGKVPVKRLVCEVRPSRQLRGITGLEESLYVSFDYSPAALAAIKGNIRPRMWDGETKEWELPPDSRPLVFEVLFDVDGIPQQPIDLGKAKTPHDLSPVPLRADYTPPIAPYPHQMEAVYFGMRHDGWLLLDEMGSGKTVCAMNLALQKVTPGKKTLIVVGYSGLKYKWRDDAKEFCGVSAHILGYKEGRKNISSAQKLEDIESRAWKDAPFIITNDKTLQNKECLKALKAIMDDGTVQMIIADECHVFKNMDAKQTKGLHWLRPKDKNLPFYRLGMTGTLFKNSPVDAYSLLKWTGETAESFSEFKGKYCFLDRGAVIGYHDLQDLALRVSRVSLRRTKDELLDPPGKTYVTEWVELDSDHRRIYSLVASCVAGKDLTGDAKKLLQKALKPIDLITPPKDYRVLMGRLKQATCEPREITSEYTRPGAKIDRAIEIAEEAAANGGKTIIFSFLEPAARIAAEAAKHLGAVKYTGKMNDEERRAAEHAFKTDKKVKVLCGTVGALGVGLTLNEASTVIFTDLPWTSSDFEQAVDRAHRIGQSEHLTIYTILAKDTSDEHVRDIVQGKKQMGDFLLDGKVSVKKVSDYLLSEQG